MKTWFGARCMWVYMILRMMVCCHLWPETLSTNNHKMVLVCFYDFSPSDKSNNCNSRNKVECAQAKNNSGTRTGMSKCHSKVSRIVKKHFLGMFQHVLVVVVLIVVYTVFVLSFAFLFLFVCQAWMTVCEKDNTKDMPTTDVVLEMCDNHWTRTSAITSLRETTPLLNSIPRTGPLQLKRLSRCRLLVVANVSSRLNSMSILVNPWRWHQVMI